MAAPSPEGPITNAEYELKYPHFWKLQLEFFPIENFFRKTAKWGKFTYFKLIMSEVSANLKNIFFSIKPPILKFEVGFFSDRKTKIIWLAWLAKFCLAGAREAWFGLGGSLASILSILSNFEANFLAKIAITNGICWSWAWFSENTPTYGDFEIGLDTPQLHQILKPIKLLTLQKKNLNSCFYRH